MSGPSQRSAAGLFHVIDERGWGHSEAARRLGIKRVTLVGLRYGHFLPGLQTMDLAEAALPEYSRDWLFPRIEKGEHRAVHP